MFGEISTRSMPASSAILTAIGFDSAVIEAGLIDQLDLCVADFIIGARPVFGGGGRGSVGTANGWLSNVVNEGDSLKE